MLHEPGVHFCVVTLLTQNCRALRTARSDRAAAVSKLPEACLFSSRGARGESDCSSASNAALLASLRLPPPSRHRQPPSHFHMSQTILIVGATGNTGRTAVHELSRLAGAQFHLLALSRSVTSDIALTLGKLPGVTIEGKNWTEIDAAWLVERNIKRVFIAPQNGPSQFTDETEFHLALRDAKVQHVVRVSTLTHYVHADSPVYYGRSHWAVENFLDQPALGPLGWTSLQPNFFTSMFMAAAAEWIKDYRTTGKQATLKLLLDDLTPAALIHPSDVGALGAAILALSDEALATHRSQRYILAGPSNIKGCDIVAVVEKIVGVKVEDVKFRDDSALTYLAEIGAFEKRLVPSVLNGLVPLWNGTSSREGAGNSSAVVELREPQLTIEDALREMILV